MTHLYYVSYYSMQFTHMLGAVYVTVPRHTLACMQLQLRCE
jgi:hypothetical protein